MKPKNVIVIIVVVLAVVFLGYVSVRNTEHEEHGHDHSEISYDKNDHEEHEGDEELSDHDEHEDHQEHESQSYAIELTPEEIQEIGLETNVASSGTIDITINLVGEIKVNQDRMAHVVPRVEGVVAEVKKKLGDIVKKDEVIAVIESQQLADAKASYLAAFERYQMAKLSFDREEKLWKEKISSEQDYLEKKQALTEAGIEKRAAEQKLHAIGFDEVYLEKLTTEPEQLLTRFEIKAPFAGTIIEKHIVLGELVGTDSSVYIVADLSSVWVDMQVYPKDIRHIKEDQDVAISTDSEIPTINGLISYVGPIVGTESRTAFVRAVIPNKKGVFRPGLYVTAEVVVSKTQAKTVVSKSAIQSLEGKKCVFIKDDHGFEPTFVEVGIENANKVEILSGLDPGQEYVTKGAFTLKSKIVTSTLDSHAGHGH